MNKKSPANAKGNAQQRCMFESRVKQNQSPKGARRPAANYLFYMVLLVLSRGYDAVTCLARPTPYKLEIANFLYPLSFSAFVRNASLRIYGKALRFLKLKSFRQPKVKIW